MKTPKRLILMLGVMLFILLFAVQSFAFMNGKDGHDKFLYPIVRVSTDNAGGSGTVIYSYLKDQFRGANKITGEQVKSGMDPGYSTYVLTNHHVIANAIRIEDIWDSNLKKEIKEEKRAIVYVEAFRYRDLSIPVGTLKVEADIVLYNENEDMALLKLRSTESEQVAILPSLDYVDNIKVLDETIAVGCSLGFPPLPTPGILTRRDVQIDSLPYHMSSSQIIYGNSGGAIFDGAGTLIGIPSRVVAIGWGTPISHMGLFIPISRVYNWLEKEHYDFLYDASKTETECLKVREEDIEKKKENG